MKGFWKYFTLTMLLILGLACIGVLYLFFVPNSTLFNIKYISRKENISATISSTNVSTINLTSRSFDVDFVTNEGDQIIVEVFSNTFGFVLEKNSQPEIHYISNAGTLTLKVVEPHGAAFKNSSYIRVSLPEEQTFNLVLSNKNADTTIDNEKIHINNLTYTTTSGYFNLNKAKLDGNLTLNLAKAHFTIGENITKDTTNVSLNVTSGRLKAETSVFNNISILGNERGVILIKSCNQLTENVSSAGGRIEAETVSHLNIKSSGTDIYVKTVTNGAIIELDSGDVKIDSLTGTSSTINTNSGDITVGDANSTIIVETNEGNINISNARKTVSVTTEYGDVNVTYHEEAASNTTDSTARYLIAALKNGKLTASGVEKTSIHVTGNGRVNLTMKDVIGESSIIGNDGSVYVEVNKNAIYKLVTESESSVLVNLAQVPNYGGYTTKESTTTYVNCSSGNNAGNVLDVKTKNGSLTILDTLFTETDLIA